VGDDEPAPTATPLVMALTVQGISHTRHGHSAWINGEVVRTGESFGGWRVDISSTQVLFRAPDQADVVLRPGQGIELSQATQVDVVPEGSYRVKKPSTAYK
jgi:hypothetical protein